MSSVLLDICVASIRANYGNGFPVARLLLLSISGKYAADATDRKGCPIAGLLLLSISGKYAADANNRKGCPIAGLLLLFQIRKSKRSQNQPLKVSNTYYSKHFNVK